MTFIILEGVDGAGKTTLGQHIDTELAKRFPDDEIITIHHSQLDQDPLDEYIYDVYSDYVPNTGRHFIVDRHYLGELIYGPLYREESAVGKSQRAFIEMWLQKKGAILTHVYAPLDVVRTRLNSRGEDYLQSHHVDFVHSQFNKLAVTSPIHKASVDTDTSGDEYYEQVNTVVEAALFFEASSAELNGFGTYYGPTMPQHVLVSTQADQKGSEFLLNALVDPNRYGVVSLDFSDYDDAVDELLLLDEALFDPTFVALDDAAAKIARDAVNTVGEVPSPESVLALYGEEVSEQYGFAIKDAAEKFKDLSKWTPSENV